jgi:hypothetical protein
MKNTVKRTLEALKNAGLINEFSMSRIAKGWAREAYTHVKTAGAVSISEETYGTTKSVLYCDFETGDVGCELARLCRENGWSFSSRTNSDEESGSIAINCRPFKGRNWWS